MTPPLIRLAKPHDEAALYDLLIRLNEDNGFGVSINRDKVLAQIRLGTEERGGIIGVVDGPDGKLIATVGLFFQSYWQSDEMFLQELWLFVDVDHRKGGELDRALFRFAKEWRERLTQACGFDVTLVTSVSSPKRLAAKERLWKQRLGPDAQRVGAIYTLNSVIPSDPSQD